MKEYDLTLVNPEGFRLKTDGGSYDVSFIPAYLELDFLQEQESIINCSSNFSSLKI